MQGASPWSRNEVGFGEEVDLHGSSMDKNSGRARDESSAKLLNNGASQGYSDAAG